MRHAALLQEAHAREERIELLRRQIARRMLHRDVRIGWNSWYSLWRAKVGERVEAEKSNHERSHKELTAELTEQTEEISSLREALEAQKAAAAHEKRVALERLRTWLDST